MSTGLRIEHVSKHYQVRGGLFGTKSEIVAVDDVSLEIIPGTTLGLVGESGSGKSTLARLALALEPPSSGRTFLGEEDLAALLKADRRSLRRRVQVVFQDPYGALSPRMRVLDAVQEPLRIQGMGNDRAERRQLALAALNQVGLDESYAVRLPNQLSGGQRQRVVIARALIVRPELLVCDEPTSALDVSVQARVLSLLKGIQRELSLTSLFISHDLGVVRRVADATGVMYRGSLVEIGPAEALYHRPLHPYSRLLRDAMPSLTPRRRAAPLIEPETSPRVIGRNACRFADRCPIALEVCWESAPPLRSITPGHLVACHRVNTADHSPIDDYLPTNQSVRHSAVSQTAASRPGTKPAR